MSIRDRERTDADLLAHAIERWQRAVRGAARMEPALSAADPSGQALAELARRLDDSGCAFGRVSAARLDHLTKAYDRLETKLNAVLLAVTGTFLSTLASLLLYYVRGGGH
jgi:hypothetical protein